jgi:ATP-binding cassette subfamily C protein
MLLGALAEGFGLLMIIPLAAIAVGQRDEAFGPFSGVIAGIPPDRRFVLALSLFVGAMAARSALLYARDLTIARLQAGYEASLRLRAAATLAERGWPFASRVGQAGMQSLLLVDVSRAANAIAFIQQVAIAVVMLTIQFLLTMWLSPPLALGALAIVAAGLLFTIRWTRRGVRSGFAMSSRFEEATDAGFRLHSGLKAALAQGTVPQFIAEYRSTLERTKSEVTRFARDLATSRQSAALAAAVAAALLLYAGIKLLALPFPVLIASLALFARMTAPAQALQQGVQNFAAYAPSFAAIQRKLGELRMPRIKDTIPRPLDWRELRADAAAFEHQPGLGIKHASFVLGRGEWIGLSGLSGAGKTTLIDLVAGLLAPTTGAITVDGKALEGSTLECWRAGLAYVGQDGAVFNDTVRGNLLAEGARADDDALWRVLERVGLDGRVRDFASGLDESVGDRGSQLSGGERQRLVIARALLRRPSLLILDEATSALDAGSEAAVLERLRGMEPRPAALIVAHREATLAYCDSRFAIQHGKLEKSGE